MKKSKDAVFPSFRITSLIIDNHLKAEKLLGEFQALKEKDFPAAKKLFLKIKADLEKHMATEENVLFPLFENRNTFQGSGPASSLRNEHEQIRSLLNDLKALLMRRKTKKDERQEKLLENRLLKILKAHEDKEEEVFYPWLDKVLPEVEKEMAIAQMAVR